MLSWPPLFAYGFRPFFLCAGLYAVVAIVIWILALHGINSLGSTHIWHAHEMLFGFVAAAIAGFLLTAIPSWTGRRGYAGAPLVILTLIWLAGRISFTFTGNMPPLLMAIIDLAFLPMLALTVLPALIRSGNRRNMIFIILLALLFSANLHFHINGATDIEPLLLGINVMLFTVTMVGRRLIPSFTSAGFRQGGIDVRIRSYPFLDKVILLAMAAILIVDIIVPDSKIAALLAIGTALLLTVQIMRWHGLRTLRQPIVWVLHLGYTWIPIALILKAAWLLGIDIPATSWLHALTSGAFSTMILGVMSRAALGHTGRALIIPAPMVIGYVLLSLAAVCRVFAPILHPQAWLTWISIAALFWIMAFILFIWVYAPILCSSRADGRPG